MTAIYFVGIYFLVKGINFKFIKKIDTEKGDRYMTIAATILILSMMEKWGVFSGLMTFLGF